MGFGITDPIVILLIVSRYHMHFFSFQEQAYEIVVIT